MGLFRRTKKEAPKQPQTVPPASNAPQPNTGIVVLFDRPQIEIEELKTAISQKFGDECILQIDNSHPAVTHLMLRIDGFDVICSYMPFPLPREEGDLPSLMSFNHFMSQEEQQSLMEHKSFCILSQIGGGSTLEGKRAVCLMLTKLCGSLLHVEGAAGVYYSAAHLLLGKNAYLKYVLIAEQEDGNPEYFPTLLWILVCQTHDGNAHTVETCGLEQFGFLELVFYKPAEEWAQSYEKLYIMSTLQITGKELYKNMDTICFTEDEVSIFKQDGKRLVVIGGI